MKHLLRTIKRTLCLSLSTAMLGTWAATPSSANTVARATSTAAASSITTSTESTTAASTTSASADSITTQVFQTSSAYDLGIDADNVRLGWKILTEKRGVYQTAYDLIVTDEAGNVAWDSGWVESSAQTGIKAGRLLPETIYRARVNIRTSEGTELGFGEALTFETAPSELEGEWLTTGRLLRSVFTLEQPLANVDRARCYFASTGIIEIRLNGGKVGDLIWGPRKGVADKVAYYNTFDVTAMLLDGDNCVGAYVGGSPYLGHALCGMLRIRYKDGSVQTVRTGTDWQATASSEIVTENVSKGENIDLSKKKDWDTPGFRAGSGWKKAETVGFSPVNGELTIPANAGTFKTYQKFSGNYTIEAVVAVKQGVASIEFGVVNSDSNCMLWQVGTSGLRLHLPGWTDISTPTAKGLGANKKVTMRIEIVDGNITTYINGTKVHNVKVPGGQTSGSIGIRSAQDEIGVYDRITVTQNGEVIWEDNFDTVDTSKWNFPDSDVKSVPSTSGTKVLREIKPVSCRPVGSGEAVAEGTDLGAAAAAVAEGTDLGAAAAAVAKGTDLGATAAPTAYILDFGVNMQGYVKMEVSGTAKDKYKIEYSEMLGEDGDIWANTTAHKPVSTYTLSGGNDVFEPRFFYTGFRYIRVTPPAGVEFDPNIFTACFTSDDVPQTGFFESSSDRLNQVFEMYNVSQRSNMMGNYTDCPQREKNGWLGDAAVTKESCALLLGDWSTAEAFLDAMLMDVKDDGRPEVVIPRPSGTESGAQYDITWASAIFIFPYELYMQTGDRYYIEHSIDTLLKVFEYARGYEKNYIVTHNVYGDWVGLDDYGAGLVDRSFLSASTYYHCGVLLSEMLRVIGRDSSELDEYLGNVYDAIQKKYFHTDYYGTPSQTCNAMALDFGLVPANNIQTVVNKLLSICEDKGRVLGTGVLGTKSIYDALSAVNQHKILLDMTISAEKGSFGFMIDNGATSLWEYWDTPGNNFNSHAGDFLAYFDSLNHVMLGGGPACWMFQGLGGVRGTGAGFSTVTLRPGIESGLSYVNCSVDALIGRIESNWIYSDGEMNWEVRVPANSTATLVIPISGIGSLFESGTDIFEKDGNGIRYAGRGDNGELIYIVGGGSYSFSVNGTGIVDNNSTSGNDADASRSGLSAGMIALIALGGVAICAATAAVVALRLLKRKNKS